MVIGDIRYLELSGSKIHELPPLLVRMSHKVTRLDRVVEMAGEIAESDDMIPAVMTEDQNLEFELERQRMDLSLDLVQRYLGIVVSWQWGDDVLEWIRQCELTFGTSIDLRFLLRPNLWPHAGRSSFVRLLLDKSVPTKGIELEKAVGMRLTFRQPPPLRCFSDQFLYFLNNSVAQTAYDSWAGLSPDPVSAFPPERFHFEVVDMTV
jgi:hypothetical protein